MSNEHQLMELQKYANQSHIRRKASNNKQLVPFFYMCENLMEIIRATQDVNHTAYKRRTESLIKKKKKAQTCPSTHPSSPPKDLRSFTSQSHCMSSANQCIERSLFGGAISSNFPLRFQDLSDIRQVPDHQEAFADPSRDESLVIELLDFKHDVQDNGSATWFFQDLATEQEAENTMVVEQSGVFQADGLRYKNVPAVVTTAVGQMNISKGKQGREAQNIVKVYLANLRLKEVGTDVLITAYEPIVISPFSETAATVGAGLAVPAAQSGCMAMSDVFKLAVSSFKVHDWNLFGIGI
ncbi:hypothetical protein AQUCO_00200569v1 [Aquilegia coerulea]|uniref:Uncharacterized protein n=1 Tax=Aquilegia coerulea TaxID=218851 RepID=A0A2G5F3U5_AQUCA|nr:hypothetical protein AQUCO_00200569v1 [Aquilegia coerulea]